MNETSDEENDEESKYDTGQNAMQTYQIRLQGHLGRQWATWFEGLTITLGESDETVLTGPVMDQAALYGLLRKVRDVGLPLLSVTRIESNSVDSLEL
ncbi:MAG: hypothetical protein R2932_54320 [Caldilineaceae bacterium]